MTANRLLDVQAHGQSIWMDAIRRSLIESGKLERLAQNGVTGLTSNPTIFAQAIGQSEEYDAAIASLVRLTPNEIYEALAVADIQAAADILRPVYDRTEGADGYVSLEVSPALADDTAQTLHEAQRLFGLVNRPNVMIKIPGTDAGLPAIEDAIAAGVNINITLLFSLDNYAAVVECYLRGLERRHAAGQEIGHIASVASFFLSRIDTLADKMLENNIRTGRLRGGFEHAEQNRRLMGQAAIASAKLAYAHFKAVFEGERFATLRAAGAQVQRLLWASTSTKNPNYPDTYYVDALIGPNTVNTLPPVTLNAFCDHGTVAPTLEQDLDQAQSIMDGLEQLGVHMDMIVQQLQSDGVETFATDFERLLKTIEGKRQVFLTGIMQRQQTHVAPYEHGVRNQLRQIDQDNIIRRIWQQDASVWKDQVSHQQVIRERLGWLDIVHADDTFYAPLYQFQTDVKARGYQHLVVLGMGGASLTADVLARAFGPQPGFPTVLVLDTTDPQAIALATDAIDLDNTLFIVSTKSGETVETMALYAYFFKLVKDRQGDAAGQLFCAITDADTPLAQAAQSQNFKYLFINPANIGGRYSALSYVGLVPAAAMGLDIDQLVASARRMATACGPDIPVYNNPAAYLGALMGHLAEQGRDKVCLVIPPPIDGFGLWAEQLVAQSTGKEKRGIIPVAGVVPEDPRDFDDDRLFIYLRLPHNDTDFDLDVTVENLALEGHPTLRLDLETPYDLGGEFFRWQLATVISGHFLGINPFDQPNIIESKEKTTRLLSYYHQHGELPPETPVLEEDGLKLFADRVTVEALRRVVEQRAFNHGELINLLLAHMSLARSGDYLAIMAYLAPTPNHNRLLENIREELRHATTRAVTIAYGPRYLHSTGQLHKGGPNNGVFIHITADNYEEIPIPGEAYDFLLLKQTQAQGDLEALQAQNRRVVRFHLPVGSISAGLERLLGAIKIAAAKKRGW